MSVVRWRKRVWEERIIVALKAKVQTSVEIFTILSYIYHQINTGAIIMFWYRGYGRYLYIVTALFNIDIKLKTLLLSVPHTHFYTIMLLRHLMFQSSCNHVRCFYHPRPKTENSIISLCFLLHKCISVPSTAGCESAEPWPPATQVLLNYRQAAQTSRPGERSHMGHCFLWLTQEQKKNTSYLVIRHNKNTAKQWSTID